MRKRDNMWITIFLLPSLVLFGVVYAIPVFRVIYTSFFDLKAFSTETTFVGLANYIQAFTGDKVFKKALLNTGIWVLLQGVVHVAIGATLAIILADKPRGWKFFRTAFMVPNMISAAALGMILLNIFNAKYGVVNSIIRSLGFKDFEHNWYFNSSTAFGTVTLVFLLYAGLITILVMAEIMSIPKTIYEAAAIDGATTFQQKIFITLPLLRNVLGTCVIISTTSMLKQFELIYLTTEGGPGIQTINLPLYLYKTALLEFNYGYANMIGTVLILLGIICIYLVSKTFKIGQNDM